MVVREVVCGPVSWWALTLYDKWGAFVQCRHVGRTFTHLYGCCCERRQETESVQHVIVSVVSQMLSCSPLHVLG